MKTKHIIGRIHDRLFVRGEGLFLRNNPAMHLATSRRLGYNAIAELIRAELAAEYLHLAAAAYILR